MTTEKAITAKPVATNAETVSNKVETGLEARATDAPESKEATHENA